MSKYSVQVIEGVDAVSAVEQNISSQVRVFQTTRWLSIVGSSLKTITCTDESGTMKGYLPLVKSSKFKIKGYHVPPYTPYSGPVFLEKDIYKKAEIAEALIRPLFAEKHLDFVVRIEDGDLIPFSRLGFSINARQTHVVNRSVTYDINQIHSSKRRYLKKLLENLNSGNFTVRKGVDAVPDLLILNQKTEERAGFKGNSAILSQLVHEFASTETVLVIYSKEGQPLAGAFCPRDDAYAYHLINASDRSTDNLLDKANLLSTYLMVQSAISSGLSFDFEGSNIPGIANFYRMMGGTPTINFRLQKSRSTLFGFMRAIQQMRTEQYAGGR